MHVTLDALSNIHDPEILERHRTSCEVHRYYRSDTSAKLFSASGFEIVHQKYVLGSDFARDELIYFIRNEQQWRDSSPAAYRRLCEEEKALEKIDAGLTLLCRARRV